MYLNLKEYINILQRVLNFGIHIISLDFEYISEEMIEDIPEEIPEEFPEVIS